MNTSLPWRGGFHAVNGSVGVVKAVKETPGAIGYIDYGYVIDDKLNAVQLKNAAGEFIKPSASAFRMALYGSEWVSQGTFATTLTNEPGKGTWPIVMGTYVLVPEVTDKPEQTQRALKFFVWAFLNGDELVRESNFVRLPDGVQGAAFNAIASVKDKAGNSIGLGLLGKSRQAR